VVDHATGDPVVMDGLHTVAVRIEQEAAVVILPVLRSRPGCAVVLIPRLCAGTPERVDELAGSSAEADVQPTGDGSLVVGVRKRELPAPNRVLLVAAALLVADRAEHEVVEHLARRAVGNADRDVVDHLRQFSRRRTCLRDCPLDMSAKRG